MLPTSQQPSIAQKLLSHIQELPLWVKQVLYLKLRDELTGHFVPDSLNGLSTEDTIAFYIPKITDSGESSLLDIKGPQGKLLMDAKQKFTILDICLRNGWSLEECCQYLIEAFKAQWLKPPTSIKALGTIEYLSNQIRLGEYLVKMGRISPDQLEQALRTQQYIKEALQEHTGLANILINLGYITRQDTEGILFLKEESRKPFDNVTLFELLK